MSVSLDGHRDRMRERVENIGPEDIRSQELIEFLLYYAVPRRDTKQMAFDLLKKFGSLEGLMQADEKSIAKVEGIGSRTAHWLGLIGNLTGLYSISRGINRHSMGNFARSGAFLERLFIGADYNQVWQCNLNEAARFISAGKMSDHASWAESEYLRDGLEYAISAHASNVIIGQYSPDPGADFEEYDVTMTKAYAVTLAAADIQLMDHVLICPGGMKSMFAEGKLDHVERLPGSLGLMENYLMEDMASGDDDE